jgi:hypothetical protein
MLRYALIGGAVAALLVLDWAALHDIATGEPDLTAEYAMLGVSVVLVALLLRAALGVRRRVGQGRSGVGA